MNYTYNSARLRSGLSLQQPTGTWANGFGYDAGRRLATVTFSDGTFTYTYKGPGTLVTNLDLPNTSKITNAYDNVARLTGTSLISSGGSVLNMHEYLYNPGNQRIRHTRTDGSYYTNNYDNIGQLVWADSTVAAEDRGYLYDAAWNLNHRTNNGVSTTFTVDSKNQLTGGPTGSYTYDDNGNLTAAGATSYTYDAENQLNSAQVSAAWRTEFIYDGRGRLGKRIDYTWSGTSWEMDSETRYIYDGMRVIQERDASNVPRVSYTRGIDLSGSLEGGGGICCELF